MSNDFINFDDIIGSGKKLDINDDEIDNSYNEIIFDTKYGLKKTGENLINLYQVQAYKDKQYVIIKNIGSFNKKKSFNLYDFKLMNYKGNIISYILSDDDINFANDNFTLKMIGLAIYKKTKKSKDIKLTITLLFYTSAHKKESKPLSSYITNDDKNNYINGYFRYELKYFDKDNCVKTEPIGNIIKLFPGKTQCIYDLISFLSHKQIMDIL